MQKTIKRTLFVPHEWVEQADVIEWCELSKIDVIHIPNDEKRSFYAAKKKKKMGMSNGFPDLFFPIPNREYHGLMIEMKRKEFSTCSLEQIEWIRKLNTNGYLACFCYGAEDAIEVIKNYINNKG